MIKGFLSREEFHNERSRTNTDFPRYETRMSSLSGSQTRAFRIDNIGKSSGSVTSERSRRTLRGIFRNELFRHHDIAFPRYTCTDQTRTEYSL